MKILILANKFPYPPRDGGAIATFSMIKGLSQLHHDITVLAINTSKHFYDIQLLPEEVKNFARFLAVEINTDISVIGLLINLLFSSIPYNAKRFINIEFEKKIIDLCMNNHFDIIQLEGLYMCPYISAIRKISNAKISFRAHNIESEIWERMIPSTNSFFKRQYLRILSNRIRKYELSFINSYDLLIPISLKDSQWFVDMGNKMPNVVIPTGIEVSTMTNSSDYEYPSVFYLGGLDWMPNQQGIKWFIDNCWESILEQLPNLKLNIAGRNAPDNLINYFSTKKNLTFFGEIPDAKTMFLSKAIMIVPLFAGSGMRIKIMEAMGYGRAIVTTSVGMEGIYASDRNEILIANTKEEFINNVIELSTNKYFFNQICQNAYNFASAEFNNLRIISLLSDFYKNNIT